MSLRDNPVAIQGFPEGFSLPWGARRLPDPGVWEGEVPAIGNTPRRQRAMGPAYHLAPSLAEKPRVERGWPDRVRGAGQSLRLRPPLGATASDDSERTCRGEPEAAAGGNPRTAPERNLHPRPGEPS